MRDNDNLLLRLAAVLPDDTAIISDRASRPVLLLLLPLLLLFPLLTPPLELSLLLHVFSDRTRSNTSDSSAPTMPPAAAIIGGGMTGAEETPREFERDMVGGVEETRIGIT